MPRMFYGSNILQFVINRFNKSSMPDNDLVFLCHQDILHISFEFGYQLYSI